PAWVASSSPLLPSLCPTAPTPSSISSRISPTGNPLRPSPYFIISVTFRPSPPSTPPHGRRSPASPTPASSSSTSALPPSRGSLHAAPPPFPPLSRPPSLSTRPTSAPTPRSGTSLRPATSTRPPASSFLRDCLKNGSAGDSGEHSLGHGEIDEG